MLNKLSFKTQPKMMPPLDIAEVRGLSTDLNETGDYIISIESMPTFSICQHCGRKSTLFHGHGRGVELRHLSVLGYRTFIHRQIP